MLSRCSPLRLCPYGSARSSVQHSLKMRAARRRGSPPAGTRKCLRTSKVPTAWRGSWYCSFSPCRTPPHCGCRWVPARARALALASRPRGLAAIGSYLLTAAFRSAPASLVAPFECSALLWGIAIDRVVWHVLPSMRSGTSGPAPEPCHHNSHGSGARGKAECRADRRQWKTSLANKRKTHHEHRRYPWTIYLARVVDD